MPIACARPPRCLSDAKAEAPVQHMQLFAVVTLRPHPGPWLSLHASLCIWKCFRPLCFIASPLYSQPAPLSDAFSLKMTSNTTRMLPAIVSRGGWKCDRCMLPPRDYM